MLSSKLSTIVTKEVSIDLLVSACSNRTSRSTDQPQYIYVLFAEHFYVLSYDKKIYLVYLYIYSSTYSSSLWSVRSAGQSELAFLLTPENCFLSLSFTVGKLRWS